MISLLLIAAIASRRMDLGSLVVAALAVLGVSFLLGLVAFAVYESSGARRQRRAIVSLRAEAPGQRAATAVVRARGEFSHAVEAYEAAMATVESLVSSPLERVGVGGSAGSSGGSLFTEHRAAPLHPPTEPGPTGAIPFGGAVSQNDIALLEQRKEVARTRLLDAQRLWDSVRPAQGPESPLELWSGTGVLRGWQLGPIGFERSFVRCEHVVDPECWSSWEVKRLRLGFAFGMEEQHLALFSAAVPVERLGEILGRSLGGPEFACRPGFSPMRAWRRARRIPEARRAAFSLLTTRTADQKTDAATRATVRNAVEVELGRPLDELRSLTGIQGVMSILASGPSGVIGIWAGRTPQAELLAASAHTAWHQQGPGESDRPR